MHTQFLNTSVYEVVITADKKTQPLIKQINNNIRVTNYSIERMSKISFNQLKEMIDVEFKKITDVEAEFYYSYPLLPGQEDEIHNFTVITGGMLKEVKVDPTEPISVPVDENGESDTMAALEDLLTHKSKLVPFALAMVESEKYMFDISFSHTPTSAVTIMDDTSEIINDNDDIAQIPLGVDLTEQPHMSDEKFNLLKAMEHSRIRQEEAWEGNPTEFVVDMDVVFNDIKDEFGFETQEDMFIKFTTC